MISLVTLMYLWPNLIHETLHYAVLKLYGIEGYITFDFTYPIRPTTTHTEAIVTVTQGLLFRLAPSLFSLLVLGVLYFTRSRSGYITHIVLPVYLTFDLVINMLGYNFLYNDFSFFRAFNVFVPISLSLIVGVLGSYVVMASIKDAVRRFNNEE